MAQPDPTERTGSRSVAAGVVLASGSGTRVGAAVNKVYLPLAGRPVVAWSLAALAAVPDIGVLVLVVRDADRELAGEIVATLDAPVELVPGGASRQESELLALRALAGRITSGAVDTVLIHDAARPLVTPELAADVLRTARAHGGAIPGLPRTDLLRVDAAGTVVAADLGRLVTVQTPQGYRAAPLLAAYLRAAEDGFVGTDTAACMARYSDLPTRCIPGSAANMKITYPYDLAIAEQWVAGHTQPHDVDGVRGVRLHR